MKALLRVLGMVKVYISSVGKGVGSCDREGIEEVVGEKYCDGVGLGVVTITHGTYCFLELTCFCTILWHKGDCIISLGLFIYNADNSLLIKF